MFYKVVYTYKEEGEGSPMYKHAIIPRREWWEKKVFGPWSRLLDDKNTTLVQLQGSSPRPKWAVWTSSRSNQEALEILLTRRTAWSARCAVYSDHRQFSKWSSPIWSSSIIKMISQVTSTQRSSSVTTKIIVNHQNDHCQSSKWSPGEWLPHWSLLPDQLRLGQLLDIHHWGSVFMLSWPLTHMGNQETGGIGNNVVANGRLHMQK